MNRVRLLLALASALALAAPAAAQPALAFDDAALHAVQFVDASEGWACGDDGTVWHSIDGGKTWERQKTGTRASLRGLHFVTPYTGWAVGRLDTPHGSVGVMLQTTDGGLRWAEVGTNVMPGLSAVRFFDEKNGLVCGDGSPAFPAGLFATDDGGLTWNAVKGPRLPSTRAVEALPKGRTALLAGAWGRLGGVTLGKASEYREAELDPLGGRAVHALAVSNSAAFAACDGGAVLTSTDGGKSWGYLNLGLPSAALAACDFRCVAAHGSHVWVAGRPGGFVLHSADHGKTWEVQKTELCVPVNAICFVSETEGWMAGELGCVYGTTDGGKTWKVQRAGGQRAAALFLHAGGASVPLDVVATLGGADGYFCASVALMNADPATADPKKASDALCARGAMRLVGGVSAEGAWAFPLTAHAAGLPPRELLASWDRAHGGKANEQLLRSAVLAIRTWQPEVVVCDLFAADLSAPEALALNAAKEAFKQAADPNCFPEQITTLGLKPWAAKKLYALSGDPRAAQVKLDQTAFANRLNDSPKDYAESAARVLSGESADRRCFVLVAHRLEGSEGHANLLEGVSLAPGGVARRNATSRINPAEAVEKQKAVQARKTIETLAGYVDTELGGAEKLLGTLAADIKKMPDDVAARTAFGVGTRLAREGKWVEAREAFGVLTVNYPGHPLAVEAFRWLTRYHASTEARRRTEIQQKLLLRNVGFEATGAGNVKPASGTVQGIGTPVGTEDVYRFYSPNQITAWHQACLNLEPKLSAFGSVYARDPSAWLCFLAARRQLGQHAEVVQFVSEYFKRDPAALTMPPGADPWRDCLASELWLANPNAIAAPAKPLGFCRVTDSRPLLDGKLDDECWTRTAKPLPLKALTATSDKADDLKAFGEQYKTEALFSYDERYLYIGLRCAHPVGKKVDPAAKRTRDADLNGRDRVDVLIDLDRDYQTYYRFQIDHRGCLAEDCWGDKGWNPKYHVAFHATDAGWSAEIAIPLVELTGERPSHGKTWAVNVSRFVPGSGVQSWSGPADQEPRPEGMGLLQFRADK